MADILLIEPGYSNKYPPLGLMKISYFHKHVCGDFVRFAKGELPEEFKEKKWDRVYVTTLFTFEWEKTKKAFEYALSVVKDKNQVYTGGILATLMPELIEEHFPTVKNNQGLLNVPGTLGLPGDECVDTMTPDYSILEDIKDEYTYPAHDAYFTYMTRGCGMKCQFCAVQTLEPNYIPYLSIKESVKFIDAKFGPKKDLLLMDNNVLKSPQFDQIIDEIKELGFAKGATYINPKTGKKVKRYVDFNQGLDAFLLNPRKAKRLGELALRPARIAFDHIEDVDSYKKAIKMCAENGITHMSNYLLYNGDAFEGKGQSYAADTPEDLYNRMIISMDLCEELNEMYEHKTAIFSFPMRYIPLSDLKRGYVGTNWNPRYLRALQRMLIPTQGKGVASRSFFEAAFGTSPEEFVEFLSMPEEHLGWRGHFVARKDETEDEVQRRKVTWTENQSYISEWIKLFRKLGHSKEEFIKIISDNDTSIDKYSSLNNYSYKKLFIHYMSMTTLLKAINCLEGEELAFFIKYITEEFPIIYKRLVEHVRNSRTPYSLLEGVYKKLGKEFIKDILKEIDFFANEVPAIINNLMKIQAKVGIFYFKYELIKYAFLFIDAGVISGKESVEIIECIKKLDVNNTRLILKRNLDKFKKVLLKKVEGEKLGLSYVNQQIEGIITELHEQITLFEGEV